MNAPNPTPRFLLGTSLLFWGAITDRPLIGLLLAVIVEGAHWTRVRWEFDEAACSRAWQISCIAIALAGLLIWLDGNRYSALLILLTWLPVLIIPMQFIQSYGMRETLPLSAFSFLARRDRERSRRYGLFQENTSFNFGNTLFTVTMVATAVGSKAASNFFLPVLLLLSGWMLMSAVKGRPLFLLPVLALTGVLAIAGHVAIKKAENWIVGAAGQGGSGFNPNTVNTRIGKAGALELSEEIAWRLKPAENAPYPKLLRTASFNIMIGTNWRTQRLDSRDFKGLDSKLFDHVSYHLLTESKSSPAVSDLKPFTLRGTANAETPLPLPGDAGMVRDFALVGIERNSVGTVRVFPKDPVIEGTVLWSGTTNPELPPMELEDLQIPLTERKNIHQIKEQIGIDPNESLSAQLATLRTFFHKNFEYTLEPKILQPYSVNAKSTALSIFLNDERAGHCEYFATAATLILRASGIPARYTIGYGVIERDPKRGGFVLRGTHAHSWCRVWDKDSGLWVDFDPTPPDWSASVVPKYSLTQRFNDEVKRLREDFFLWRNRAENRLSVTLSFLAIGTLLGVFILRRLWLSRRKLEAPRLSSAYQGPVIQTPLHLLEPRARKEIGERLVGETFANWLARLRPIIADETVLNEAISLHQRLRFDPSLPDAREVNRLTDLVAELISQLKQQPERLIEGEKNADSRQSS